MWHRVWRIKNALITELCDLKNSFTLIPIMKHALQLSSLFLITLVFATQADFAHAQANLPEFTVIDLGELNLDTRQTGEKSYKEKIEQVDNDQMRMHLLLQNEITMLGALQSWQTQVSELESTYARAGLPFTQPEPPRTICEQIPSNSICNEAYPDLAPKPKKTDAKKISNALAVSGVITPQQSAVPAPVMARATNYEWASISCVIDNCRAVLLDKAQNLRFSVFSGETIDDGIMITKITPFGVTVSEKGKTIKLRSSAPSIDTDTASVAPVTTKDQLVNKLSDLPANALDNVEPVKPIVIDDGSNAPSAPLGNTGLF